MTHQLTHRDSPKLIADRWGVSPQLIVTWWVKKHPAMLDQILKLDPEPFIEWGERWGASSLDVARWLDSRMELMKRGERIMHPRPQPVTDLAIECHSRGFTLTQLSAATGWTPNAIRSWGCNPKLTTRLWDALLGMEAMQHG